MDKSSQEKILCSTYMHKMHAQCICHPLCSYTVEELKQYSLIKMPNRYWLVYLKR